MAFLDEGPGRPVYFAVTEAELRHLNDRRGLGIDDPLTDFQAALRPYSFHAFDRLHRKWEETRSLDLPPWLPFLAATTVVVDQQTERGSLAFYEPLTSFLGSARISQHDYEETFGRWWRSLGSWLEDEDRHAAKRGFATWASIPLDGPRCVIGHPYTQILLKREERGQLDDFVADFDHGGAPPAVGDREAVALYLVGAFRRWARHRQTVSPRLRRIVETTSGDESTSLGYVLLGRLFNEIAGAKRTGDRESVVRVVPAYDDYERVARLVAVGPSWVSARDPVQIPGAVEPLSEAGETVAIEHPVSRAVLEEGLELGDEAVARLIARSRYILAAREFDLWCEVDGALPGEDLYVLLTAQEARRIGVEPVPNVSGLPSAWVICGPMKLEDMPIEFRVEASASNRRLAPRLVGGLKIQPTVYLTGGEPMLEIPEEIGSFTIDGTERKAAGGLARLSELGLAPGVHRVGINGFAFSFESMTSSTPIEVRPVLGRNHSGVVVPFDQQSPGTDLVTGARRYPAVDQPHDGTVFPWHGELLKFGAPGQVSVHKDLALARWAREAALPHLAIELYARSTYPNGDRVIRLPSWIAWQDDLGIWTVVELGHERAEVDHHVPFDFHTWTHQCGRIGTAPRLWSQRGDQVDSARALERWRSYIRAAMG